MLGDLSPSLGLGLKQPKLKRVSRPQEFETCKAGLLAELRQKPEDLTQEVRRSVCEATGSVQASSKACDRT